jgi:hypothetical protein
VDIAIVTIIGTQYSDYVTVDIRFSDGSRKQEEVEIGSDRHTRLIDAIMGI